jgi:hypothetical protein
MQQVEEVAFVPLRVIEQGGMVDSRHYCVLIIVLILFF